MQSKSLYFLCHIHLLVPIYTHIDKHKYIFAIVIVVSIIKHKVSELAKSSRRVEGGRIKDDVEEENKRVVQALYEALAARDVEKVHKLLAPDLEWWFHGPPAHQHLMHLLTGGSSTLSLAFLPVSIVAFGSTIIAQGHHNRDSWIHAWTVTHGIITQVREYMNTSLTVTLLAANSTQISHSIWQSTICDHSSVPGLVLALN